MYCAEVTEYNLISQKSTYLAYSHLSECMTDSNTTCSVRAKQYNRYHLYHQ